MKRLLVIAAVLLMVMSLSVTASANTWVLPEGQHSYMMQVPPSGADDPPIFIYTLNEQNEAEIIDFFGEAYDLKIPKMFGKYPVVSIGDDAFTMSGTLLSVIIPDSITKIGDYAFSRCTELKSVSIPESIQEIGEYAFSGCIALESVTIPEGVTAIREGTFASCVATEKPEDNEEARESIAMAHTGEWLKEQVEGMEITMLPYYKIAGHTLF